MFIGLRSPLYWGFRGIHRFEPLNKKAENLLRRNQKLATSLDFSCSCNLSAIRAMNSEFVGFPFVLLTVYPKNLCRVSRSPLSQATSMACLIARSTLEGVVWKVLATWGYNTLVMAFTGLSARWRGFQKWVIWKGFCEGLIALFVARCFLSSSGL